MERWNDCTHGAMLAGTQSGVDFSTELRDWLSGQGNELSYDEAEFFLREIIRMTKSMRMTVEGGKVRALLRKK